MTLTAASASRTAPGALQVDRTDIAFENVRPGWVQIRVVVHNHGFSRSAPTTARLQSAVLGAFVPWSPLTTLAVPTIAPGGSVTLETEVRRSKLADFSGFVPTPIATATAGGDAEPPRAFAWVSRLRRSRGTDVGTAGLRGTLMGLLHETAGEQAHWLGNLNVMIRGSSTERHVAPLRLEPGRRNLALFCVGTGAFDMHIDDGQLGWPSDLLAMSSRSLRVSGDTFRLESGGLRHVFLRVEPPSDCDRGNLDVHVRRESDGASTVVEFSLDPNAVGPGCYVV